jgi:DNA polymerase III subunit gamma/tau
VEEMHEVPESLPLTEETRERLRAQANQLGEPTVLRLVDLLAVAVEDLRQGGDPRLPLELALVKVTRPGSDLSRESTAYRLEQLERHSAGRGVASPPQADETVAESPARAQPPDVALEQLQEAWQRTVLPAVRDKSIPTASVLAEAKPVALEGEALTVEFPPTASFHRKLAEEEKNASLLREALYEVTGRRLSLAFTVGDDDGAAEPPEEAPATEDEIYQLVKETFDATEVTD